MAGDTGMKKAEMKVYRDKLVVLRARLRGDVSQLQDAALKKNGITVHAERSDCLIRSTDALAAAVKRPETLGLLVTGQTAAALWLANRHAGVRAIYGCSPSGVGAGAEAAGANVLVAGTSTPLFELRQMVLGFCRGGVKECPEVFRERLA